MTQGRFQSENRKIGQIFTFLNQGLEKVVTTAKGQALARIHII